MPVANPLYMSMVPGGGNPTGTNIGVPAVSKSTTSINPYTTGIVPGGSPSSTNPYNYPMPGAGTSGLDLSGAFGPFGSAVAQSLALGGGFSPQAWQAQVNQMQPRIQMGLQNLMEQFGGAGARDSSAAATGTAEYLAQTNLNEQSLLGQEWMQGAQNYINEILGLAGPMEQYQQSRPTGWDIFQGILGDITGGISSGLFGGIGKLFGGGGGGGYSGPTTGSLGGSYGWQTMPGSAGSIVP